MKKTVTLRIEDRRHRAFKSLCAAQGVTMMDILTALIDQYIASGGAAVPANSAPARNNKR